MATTDTRRTKISILVYLALTFALSAIFYRFIIRGGGFPSRNVLGLMWCPGVAGLVTRLLFQRNLRGHGFGWGRTRYQLASCWIPLAYAAAVYVPAWLAGYADFHGAAVASFASRFPSVPPSATVVVYFAFTATVGLFFSCLSALGEELGWRGFLVPQLAKVMPFPKVALVSGCIWALWHYPVILFSFYRGAGPVWYSLVCFTVMVLSISFLFAWMRLKSGSVWTGMLLHASHNIFIQAFFDPLTRASRFTNLWTTEFGGGLALAGIAVAVIFYRKRSEIGGP